ncbi:MAG: ABC transporter ATP-binding protein [Clostridiales bacterium]|nr:ABC transporter ATP-binding protein [Clostridiales bacterium]
MKNLPQSNAKKQASFKHTRGATSPMQTIKRILGFAFSKHKAALIFVIISVIISSAANAAGAAMLAPLINEIASQVGVASPTFTKIYFYLAIIAIIYLLGVGCSFAYNRIMMYITNDSLKRMRDEMFAKMQRLPLKYFDSTTHGELMSLYTNDIDTMRQLISQSIPQLISSAITVVAVIFLMIFYSFSLTIVIFLMLAVMLFVIKTFGGKSGKFFVKQQADLSVLNGFVEEMTEGQKVIKVFNYEEKAKARFNKLNDSLNQSSYTANSNAFMLGPINNNIGYFQYILVAIVGVLIIFSGNEGAFLSIYGLTAGAGFAVGMLVSFLQFSRQLNMPLNQLSMQFNAIVMALAGGERIFAVMDAEQEDMGGEVVLTYGESANGEWAWKKPQADGTHLFIPLKGDIRFNDVVFGYNENKVVLKNISLYARPGQKIAFVGSTGAGKTTITNLINRFYDIQSGSITYDGLDIKSINKNDLRRSLGVVLQDTHLFTGTVLDNIRYGRLSATDEECINAAKQANAHSFIKRLPQGYNTMLTGDGANLSQGQRQLLSIARAMVSNCPVLILDEATSSIDTRTEKLIERGMDKLMEGRTVFVIAHRLSTVRDSDAIMVLEKGEIIERGDHDDLLAQKGKYYQLYTGMFELD